MYAHRKNIVFVEEAKFMQINFIVAVIDRFLWKYPLTVEVIVFFVFDVDTI